MNNHHCPTLTLTLCAAFCTALLPSVTSAAEPEMRQSETNQLNRFSLNARLGFNISARFKTLGRLSLVPNTRTTPDGATYNYDDGYVLTDVSGNFGDQTWNWGYDKSSQVSGDNILMHRSRPVAGSAAPAGVDANDPNLGAELAYNRELGRNGSVRWGVEVAANYLNVEFDDRSSFTAGIVRTTDTYPFTPGTTPPLAPYQGNYGGPGFVIGGTPTSSSTRYLADGALVSGHRGFDADVWGFRLGPYVDFPLGTNWNLSLSAGVAVGLVSADASWNERISINNTLVATSRGHGDDFSVLWGGYLGAKVSYRLSDHWSIEGGAQFQALGKYDESLGGRKVELDLGHAIFLVAGLSYSF